MGRPEDGAWSKGEQLRVLRLMGVTLTEALTITTTPRTDHQLDVTIQLGPERTEKALHRAARLVARKAKIPGFRPGKASDATIIRLYGRDVVLREIMDDLGQEVFREALESDVFKPYTQAHLEDVQFDPITFKLVVPLSPAVDLGDYRSTRLDVPEVNVGEADVDAALAKVRDERASWQTVERPAEIGDTVVLDIYGTVGEDTVDDESGELDADIDEELDADYSDEEYADEEFDDEEFDEEFDEDEFDEDDFDDGAITIMDNQDWELLLRAESGWLPGFDEAFVGMAAGDEKTFTLTYPEDSASRYRGQEAIFEATVKEVRAKIGPELDDEFARSLSDYENLADLRAKTLTKITAERTAEAEARLTDAAIAALVEKATISYPPVAVDEVIQEIINDLEQQLQRIGYSVQDYLRLQGTTPEAYHDQVASQAERRLQGRLILAELARVEGIMVTDEETQAELERIMADAENDDDKQKLLDLFGSEQGRLLIRQDLAQKKTLVRLREIVTGQAPELAQPEPPAEAASSMEAAEAAVADQATDAGQATDAAENAEAGDVAEAAQVS